ncbi:MAG: TerB N-terminal domain-containing protein [gamma proteobacterium symbiont of Taylorina sp.]|nr:TerB N-terminal domain-containing protein [gamma proteobacterium symbiont of Taylorina sp.]
MEWIVLLVIGAIIYSVSGKKNKKKKLKKDDDLVNISVKKPPQKGDDLVNFQITVPRNYSTSSSEIDTDSITFASSTNYSTNRSETKNKKSGKWIQPEEVVQVGHFNIKGGFIYFGGQLKSLDDYDTESSLVDHTLKINTNSPDYGGDQMGYWPSYCQISPESRAAYIEWLASDRNDPETYIGYIFLYFYGLERRLLVDDYLRGQVSDDERNALIQELKRLKNVYGDNRSFNGYITSLLSHIYVVSYQNDKEYPIQNVLLANRHFTSAFKYLLANTVHNEKPITDELALAWIRSHPEFSLRTPARRCENEFNTLFKFRYKQKYADGLMVKPNKTRLQIDYQPASSSLRGYQSIQFDLPDVSRLKAPVKKLMAIAESCTNELETYSRFVGRPGNSHNSLSAFALLPNDLASSISNPQFEKLAAWIQDQVSASNGLVSVESLLDHFGDDVPLKINKKEAEMLSNIVEKAGFGIAPDIRYHQAKTDINGKIVLFPGGHGEKFTPSHAFRQVGTILRLGAMVAAIDNHIDEAEVNLLKNIITKDNQLTEIEKSSLNAYLYWRLNTPANMAGLKSRLESINNREKTAVSHILISVALADGNIDPSEIKQLEKLYTSLGLDKSMVTSDIHNLSSSQTRASVSENKADVKTSPEIQPVEIPAFALNHDLLKMHEEETQDVQAVLESIFIDEAVLNESEKEVIIETQTSNGTISSLDEKHQSLYEKLITKEEWSMDEVKKLCEELQLMVDGAIEVINDWAFDNVDAPLIEDGSAVFIDLELAEEIAEL